MANAQDMSYSLFGPGTIGEIRAGANGQHYQWVEGVDGLGNPFGFWKKLRRLAKRARPFLRRAIPLAQRFAPLIPGVGPAVAAGITAATPFLKQAGLTGLGELYEGPDGNLYQAETTAPADDGGAAPNGQGVLGEVRRGADGGVYQWVEGVNGLGNPFGFWKRLRRLARRAQPFLRRAIPLAQQFAPLIPGVGPAVAAGITAATPYLRQAGLTGLGELYASPDGTVYEVAGWVGEGELEGLDQDDEVGIQADHVDLEPDVGATDELEGLGQCHVYQPGVTGLGAYVPETPRSRACPTPTEQAALFRPLW